MIMSLWSWKYCSLSIDTNYHVFITLSYHIILWMLGEIFALAAEVEEEESIAQ